MLVVNNGIPKSGSTLIQRIMMMTGEFVKDIGSFQHPNWNSISVANDRIAEFLDFYDFQNSNTCLKMHCNAHLFAIRNDPNIKVITSYRNLKDSIVSMGYHNLRVKGTEDKPKDHWIKNYFKDSKRYGKTACKFGLHYINSRLNGSFMVNFQDLVVDNKRGTMLDIYQHVGLNITTEKFNHIFEKTNPNIKSKNYYQEGKHVRTGGISCAKDELPEMTYNQLNKLDNYLFAGVEAEEWKAVCDKVVNGIILD